MSHAKRPEMVLIIDDTPDNLRFLSDLLSRAGYAVRKVISGELGLEAARLEPPDLILLDIKMPGLDGYQVCDRLKSSGQTRSIPVIFLSALSEELDKVMAFEAGCVDYITKPFQVVEVLARIANQLQVSRLRQALEQQNQELQSTIAQHASAETALKTLNQDLENQVQSRTAALQASLDKALRQSLTLTPETAATLLAALEKLVTVIDQLDPERPTTQPLQSIAISARSVRQILAQILPEVGAIQAAELTQFCRSLCQSLCQGLAEQWTPPASPDYQLAVVSWGNPSGRLEDAGALRQLLSQLLANALRYSPQGGSILVQITYEPDQVLIQIRDAGIGIPPHELDRIGERCYRASNAKAIAGEGLGLFLAQQIVTAQGGRLSLSSQLGQGTTVTLTLPLRPD